MKKKLKEIQFFVNISDNDFNVKIRKIKQLLDKDHDVRVKVKLKGREVEKTEVTASFISKLENNLLEYNLINKQDKTKDIILLFRKPRNVK